MGIIIHQKREKSLFVRWVFGAPLIFAMGIPIVIADICIEVYHHTVFPIFGLRMVRRADYIRILDREKLPYLTWYEKVGCAYCAYVNGWFHYASVIAGRTESYFCAIAHLEERGYQPTEFEKSFAKYGDADTLMRRHARSKHDAVQP